MTLLGFQASSLKPYLTTPNDLLATFHKLRDIGYRHLQLQWIDPSIPLEFTAEALQETGLTCIATQDDFVQVRDNLDYYVKMNQLWSSKSLCISTIPKEQMTREGLKAFAAEMLRISQVLGEQGISLTFHPLWFNFESVSGISAVDMIMALFPHEIGLTLCVMQAVRAGNDPIALLEKYRGRVEICHFKDFVVFPDGNEYLVPVGQGKIDWPPIFEACHRTGVKWGLTEQENWQKDAFVCAKESFDYISKYGITLQ
ncbi:sugar phosphate isomerase/epimerase family protein [Paenibacillus sp. FA6]|uniref:sugar phosphate isomerase/epimerase family protein n=1 Tax=Paenibacillus sp. FA6 TaxID=3413029 RepID=UPI003F65A063